ncbi:hypothetical protein GIB67_033280 [Kingdonia uniflora]|uniref:Transcription repressor n=1 Tax=Kingdonia uniflora TaxID=39325 RepID=A0A7J7MPK2_9MAGN|nr:hypothetical protein GIB67_033280 [Kingdonia uniflora]
MGKPKFKSSMKSLQQALINLRPSGPKTINWVCIQQTNTQSFREICNASSSFHSLYDNHHASSSSTSSQGGGGGGGDPVFSTRLLGDESFSCTSSYLNPDDSSPAVELVRKDGFISSKRFFFSPCTTNSIMEQAGEEVKSSTSTLTMEMASQNPYEDFKESMEEMVEAHGVKDWSGLQELLHCYLSLNEKNTHDTIVLAFVDLLINLIDDEENNLSSSSSNTTSSLSSSLSAYLCN